MQSIFNDDTFIRLTRHARERMEERDINLEQVAITLCYGQFEWSDGKLVYEIEDRNLVGSPHEHLSAQLRGLRVVASPHGDIVTVMWRYDVSRAFTA